MPATKQNTANNWRSADPIPRTQLVAGIQGSAIAVLGRLAKTLDSILESSSSGERINMIGVNWQFPRDNERCVLENPSLGKSFNDPLESGDLVKLRTEGKFVQVAIKDPANPQAIKGEVALSNDTKVLKSLNLKTYDPVLFSRDNIFVRVFGG